MSNTRAASDVTVYVGDQVNGLNVSPQFDGYSKVILNVTKELYYEAGTDTGRTMTVTIPWGTQEMCNNILAKIRGYAYQPLEATGAIMDPAAELGDGVTVKDTYTMIGSTKNTFGQIMRTDIVTPHETEINHEIPYKSPTEREVDRQYANIRAELTIQADRITAEVEQRKSDIESVRATLTVQAEAIKAEVAARVDAINQVNATLEVHVSEISAKVSKTGGSSSTFGWTMTDTNMVWKANNSEIFRLDKNGAQVTGKITATSGKIGGFTIQSNYLSYNNQTWGGRNSTGIYIGTSGIQLGRNFKVDSNGNLYAYSGTFTGNVYAGNIQYGSSAGYLSGSGLSSSSVTGSKIAGSTITTTNTSSGINTSLGYADAAYSMLKGWTKITALDTGSLNTYDFTISNHQIDMGTITYTNSSGGTSKQNVLIWS